MQWSELIGEISIEKEKPSDTDEIIVNENEGSLESDGLASFKL
jgi:hypothetical protein